MNPPESQEHNVVTVPVLTLLVNFVMYLYHVQFVFRLYQIHVHIFTILWTEDI